MAVYSTHDAVLGNEAIIKRKRNNDDSGNSGMNKVVKPTTYLLPTRLRGVNYSSTRTYVNRTTLVLSIIERSGARVIARPQASSSAMADALTVSDTYTIGLAEAEAMLKHYDDEGSRLFDTNEQQDFVHKLRAAVLLTKQERGNFVNLTIATIITELQLRSTEITNIFNKKPLYIHELDVVVTLADNTTAQHPFRLVSASIEHTEAVERKKQSLMFTIDIIDRSNRWQSRFIAMHGSVFEVVPRNDPLEPEGVKVTYHLPCVDPETRNYARNEEGHVVYKTSIELYDMEEASKRFGLYKTREEAEASMNIANETLITQREELAIKRIKAENDRERDQLSKQITELNLQREREKEAHDRTMREMEERLKQEEMRHKDRTNASTEKQTEWKTIAAVVGLVAGVVAAVVTIWKSVTKSFVGSLFSFA